MEPYCFVITTPACRLSLLTPGLSPGPLQAPAVPACVDGRMSPWEKIENWGRHAFRNAMATGPIDAPVNTWCLAAPSAARLREWKAAFAIALDAQPKPVLALTPNTGSYRPVSSARLALTPVVLGAEEVM